MADIYDQIGSKIRELRTTLKGKGISQEELARAVKTTANTVSRWETATYKPSVADLEVLARFFGVPMAVFFPGAHPASRTNALIVQLPTLMIGISKKWLYTRDSEGRSERSDGPNAL